MLSIAISSELKRVLPDLSLGCVCAQVKVDQLCQPLWTDINQHLAQLTAMYKPEAVNTIPQITAMRNAYKALGKDPSRYRGSAEALLRRVLSGKGLYQVNTVVDINNLVSLESLLPAGSYDIENITPPIELRIGRPGETCKGIGKDEINIENLPVFSDGSGAFGSPTSDSERAMIRPETRQLLMVIFSFGGVNELERWMTRASDLLECFATAENVEAALLV